MKNIVVVVMDSVSWKQFSLAKTPNIDKLSSDINKTYTTASYTLPSIKAMLHGILPSRREDCLYDWNPAFGWMQNMPEWLSEKKGYTTYGFSANPLFTPNIQGVRFDHFIDLFGLDLKDSGKKLVNEFKITQLDQPFYAFFLFVDTHHPYLSIDNKKETQLKAIEYLDKQVKRIYELVPKNTDIYITSDHGELFGKDERFGHDPRPESDKTFEGGGCLNYSKLLNVFTAKISK